MKRVLNIMMMLVVLLPIGACRRANVELPPVARGNADSLLVLKGQWRVDTLDGMVLKQCHFSHSDCIGSNQYVCVLEIAPGSLRRLAFSHEAMRTPTSQQAQRHHARAALNGSFFDMRDHYPICYLRIDGVELGENTPQATDSINRKYYQYGGIALRNGRPRYFIPDSNRKSESLMADSNIMTAGPLLIHEGRLMPMRDDRTFVTQRHNRSAIATRADGTVLLIAVDGRSQQSQGLSLTDFQALLRYLGCQEALNLDGGGSTTLYIEGYPHGGIVNHPSDNNRYDFQGERPVSNCILVQ